MLGLGHDAIKRAEAHEVKLKNRDRVKVRFEAVVSVPSFEVWFLMHFCDIIPTYTNTDSYLGLAAQSMS